MTSTPIAATTSAGGAARRRAWQGWARLSVAVGTVGSLLVGCGGGSEIFPAKEGRVHFMLASVEGGTCSLFDVDTGSTRLAGPARTVKGTAVFENVDPSLGLVRVECTGGTFTDLATGVTQTAPRTRAVTEIRSSIFSATVSPLTEIAMRVVEEREDLNARTAYRGILANVATSFGLDGVDLVAVRPIDLNTDVADKSDAGHYGVALAVISELEADLGETSEEEVVTTLLGGLANDGRFTVDEVRDLYMQAMENFFRNPRSNATKGLEADLHDLFDKTAVAPLSSQVTHVDAEGSDLQDGVASTTVRAGQPSVFDIVGTHLYLGMTVKLGDDSCRLRDLSSHAPLSQDRPDQIMLAECPARAAGTADLVVLDRGRPEYRVAITIADDTPTASAERRKPLSTGTSSGAQGSSYVYGTITAAAPGITPPDSAHDYSESALEYFPVAGVTVELLDSAGALVQTTTADNDGYYEFDRAPESNRVRVVVKAEIKRERTSPNTGPSYTFTVRDNTSTVSPKRAYQLVSSEITTGATPRSDYPLDIRARVGFNAAGNAQASAQRESAPFAILRIINSAVNKLVATDPNISMPELNIYWSTRNVGADGNKNIGQIGTSHFANTGLMPGLFILGAADSDTDEFDQGVIGHEFGHYLQAKLSYSDSPGGSHSSNQFKDASLAFGEGYGTAVGGLLAGSKHYCDVSGPRQSGGFCIDLTNPVEPGEANGFYAEYSIVKLLYGIGNLPGQGFPQFFTAFSKMRATVHSATIFSFLDIYLQDNPGAASQVQALMAESNIKSSNPFGVLPAGAPADAAIGAAANKGTAAAGAPDLETLYVNLPLLTNVAAPVNGQLPRPLTQNEPTVCLNDNLQGAQSGNGLGMSRRFVFTANFTGSIGVRGVDDQGALLSDQGVYFTARDTTGAQINIWGYGTIGPDNLGYHGYLDVVQGRSYTVSMLVWNPDIILNGSQCGNRLVLFRVED